MAIHEDLIYFLKKGRFKNINFGINAEQLIGILGEPEYTGFVGKPAFIYGYNNFEFYFLQEKYKNDKTERLCCVILNHPQSYSRKSNLQFKSYNWRTNLSFGKGLEFLSKYKIEFEEIPYRFSEDYRLIKTEGNVYIGFVDIEENGNFTFHKISREIELSPFKPPTKQISFEIEKTYYEQLRNEAEKTRISIANLCREIIEEYLENKL